MKKLWMIPALVLTLAACGNDDDTVLEEEEDSVEIVESDDEETAGDNEEDIDNEKDENVEEEADTDVEEETTVDSSLANFEESAILGQNIPLDQLTTDIVEDNQNKRIILFENETGEKVYKSIFIKNDEHLKIIDISDNQNEEDLIFEGNL